MAKETSTKSVSAELPAPLVDTLNCFADSYGWIKKRLVGAAIYSFLRMPEEEEQRIYREYCKAVIEGTENLSPEEIRSQIDELAQDVTDRKAADASKSHSRLVPEDLRGSGQYTYLPLAGKGQKRATTSPGIARVAQRKLWEQFTGKAPPVQRNMESWIAEFAEWNGQTASARQVAGNCRIVREFLDHAGIARPWEIDAYTIQKYLTHLRTDRKLAPATQTHHRNGLSKFCRFLAVPGLLEGNSARQTLVEAIYHRPPRYLTGPQARDLVRAVRAASVKTMELPVLVALLCGLRLHELRAIRKTDIRPGGILIGSVQRNKTASWRVVPTPASLRSRLLAEGRAKGPIFGHRGAANYVRDLRKITRGASLPIFGELEGNRAGNQWHLLRSTWAVNAARRGMTLWQLMDAGGWKCPQTVMRYINVARAAGRTE